MLKRIQENIDAALLGSTTLVVFLIYQFLWYVFEPDYPVPMWVVMAVLIVFYICCVVIYAVCRTKTVTIRYQLPRIRNFHRDSGGIKLIVERDDLFSDGAFVTVYQPGSARDLEIPLAIGVVQITSSPDYMQINLVQVMEQELTDAVFSKSGKSSAWKSVAVKPAVSQVHLEYLLHRMNSGRGMESGV